MPIIHAVLFDYGMVLSGPPNPIARARMERVLGVSPERLQEGYWKYRDAYDRGALSGVAYWQAVADLLGSKVDEDAIAELVAADTALWTQPNEPMIAWAAALQRAGIKTGILSNLGDAMEAGIRGHFDWLQGFTHHTFSHHLGIAKPDLAIYHHAAEGLATPAGNILFIDDREDNIAGAHAAGMVTLRYTGHDDFVAAMEDLRLSHLLRPDPASQIGNL